METHPFQYSFTTCFKERVIVDFLAPGVSGAVLEIGCGSAYFASVLERKFPDRDISYVGIDLSKEALQAAGRFLRKPPLVLEADVGFLPFDDQSFDDLLYLDVIEHVANDAASLTEAFRVLKPGGRMVLSTPNARGIFTDTFFCEYMHDHSHMKNQRSGYDETELRRLVMQAGFAVERVSYTNVFLSEILITATKLGYRMLKPNYSSQSDVVEVSKSPLFTLHKNVFFPIGYAVGRFEEAVLRPFLHGHCLILLCRKPKTCAE